MLESKKYSKEYIHQCKLKIQKDLEVFQALPQVSLGAENVFFNNLVLVLELMFVYRQREQEGNDGNALNEVRMLAFSILTNKSKLLPDTAIQYKPENSILQTSFGQEIVVDRAKFVLLSNAYFEEIEKRFQEEVDAV